MVFLCLPGQFLIAGSPVESLERGSPYVNDFDMSFQWIPAGNFRMGAGRFEPNWRSNETPAHEVDFVEGFWMASCETTVALYRQVMRPNAFVGVLDAENRPLDGRRPVAQLTWAQARNFCVRLQEHERAAKRLPDGWRISLPSESQWEYACRAGTTCAYHFGDRLDDTMANIGDEDDTSEKDDALVSGESRQVASYAPNDFGLFDMHGNVAEWCLDVDSSEYLPDVPRDGSPWLENTSDNRIYRGGSFSRSPEEARSARRKALHPRYHRPWLGFRVVILPTVSSKALWRSRLARGMPFGVVGGILLLVLYGILTQRRQQLNRVFSRFARQMRGTMEPAGVMSYPEVAFSYRGISATLHIFPGGSEDATELFTCLTFGVGTALERCPLRLELVPRTAKIYSETKHRGLEIFRSDDMDEALASVIVLTNDHEEWGELRSLGFDTAMVRLDRVGNLVPAYVSLNAERFTVKKLTLIHSLRGLTEFCSAAFGLLDLVVERYGHHFADGDLVIIEEETTETVTVCNICGASIEGEACVCVRCETPHHIECWQYNGACATFACGCTEWRPASFKVHSHCE